MNCEDIRDLIPAYTIGTATTEEIQKVEEHIVDCDLHDDIVSTAASFELVGSAVESIRPPASLKLRVMAHAESSVGNRSVGKSESPRRRSYHRWIVANPIAALLVFAIGVMAVWNIMLQSADSPERFVHFYKGNENDWMRIETVLGERGAEVSLGGVEQLDESLMYNLWTTRGEQVLLVGTFNVNPEGRWAGEFEFVFEEGDRVWMTEEMASGVEKPTGEAVLKTRF